MTEAERLLPCPFCGAKDERLVQAFTRATDDFAYWSVECLDCACEIASDASQAEADAAWNTRAPDESAQSARIAALEEALSFYVCESNWISSGFPMSMKYRASSAELDRGNKARLALGKGRE